MAQQGDEEGRQARQAGLRGLGSHGPHLPARQGGGGGGFRGGAGGDEGDAALGGGQRQAPAGGEVQDLRCAPDLGEDDADGAAAGGVVGGFQHRLRIPRPDEDETARIEPEGGDAVAVGAAELLVEHALADPDHGRRWGRPQRQAEGKSGGGGAMGRALGEDLMQRRTGEPAAESGVEFGRTEGELRRRGRHGPPLQTRKGTLQRREGVAVRGHFCSCFVL